MKKNRILLFIKKYWYFLFLLFPLISFCMINKKPDDDIWFILNNGRYVLAHGIPNIDPFSIHKGLHYIMQQWLFSIIIYLFYKKLGKYGILIFMFIFYFLLTYVYYKLCYLISNDKKKTIFIITIFLTLSHVYLVSRPQIITYIILLLETYFLELYIKRNNRRFLYPLPLLSLLLINVHCSMWFLQFVFILPFLLNGINVKELTIKKINIKPILIIMIIMFIVGLINPYGIEAITFIFNSYGIKEINENIVEMKPASINFYYWYYCLLAIFLLIVFLNYNKKEKLDIRYILFIIGTFLLASLHIKCIPYFFIWFGYAISNIKTNIVISNKYILRLLKTSLITSVVFLTIIIFPTINLLVKNYEIKNVDLDPIVKYLNSNYEKKDIVLYTEFSEGGYMEFNGFKCYLDPRAEVFVAKFNKKEDIYKESIKLYKFGFDLKKFVKKYNFTHMLVKIDNGLYEYLEQDNDYILEKKQYFDKDKKLSLYKLFVRKDISVKYKKQQKETKNNEK